MRLLLLLLLAAFALPVLAADKDCEKEPNWSAVRYCVLEQQDAELDAVYKDTLAFVRQRDAKSAGLLVQAQDAWRVFAEKSCEFTVASRLPDSNDLRLGCWQKFIAAREQVLRAYKRDFGKVPDDLMNP